ncbi:hypothetical protein E2C01_012013 [Portunus trituberculatus]|uniref:Uncharacterized protein n=1 Tax=Portunus trituberculatus TaxID=210409 RepID=A0A5B7DDH2_PORTR|nr:hypothetical protein [Portunus trituberculatus]
MEIWRQDTISPARILYNTTRINPSAPRPNGSLCDSGTHWGRRGWKFLKNLPLLSSITRKVPSENPVDTLKPHPHRKLGKIWTWTLLVVVVEEEEVESWSEAMRDCLAANSTKSLALRSLCT